MPAPALSLAACAEDAVPPIPFAPARSAYSAAKAAVNSLMTSLRLELRQELPGVHVSTVLPGVVATEFGKNAKHGVPDSRALPYAQPVEDVAALIADLIARPRGRARVPPLLGWIRKAMSRTVRRARVFAQARRSSGYTGGS